MFAANAKIAREIINYHLLWTFFQLRWSLFFFFLSTYSLCSFLLFSNFSFIHDVFIYSKRFLFYDSSIHLSFSLFISICCPMSARKIKVMEFKTNKGHRPSEVITPHTLRLALTREKKPEWIGKNRGRDWANSDNFSEWYPSHMNYDISESNVIPSMLLNTTSRPMRWMPVQWNALSVCCAHGTCFAGVSWRRRRRCCCCWRTFKCTCAPFSVEYNSKI